MTESTGSRRRLFRVIAVFKFCKAALLIVVGLGALKLIDPGTRDHARAALDVLASRYDREWLDRLIGMFDGIKQSRLHELGIGAFSFAAIFTVEGTGLWMEKIWASALTIVATASFIPFEIGELASGVLLLAKTCAFVLNRRCGRVPRVRPLASFPPAVGLRSGVARCSAGRAFDA